VPAKSLVPSHRRPADYDALVGLATHRFDEERKRATADNVSRDAVIRISELTGELGILEGFVFQDRDPIGPAVLVTQGSTFASTNLIRACFKTAQPPLGLRAPIGQLRVPIGQRRIAVAMQASSEAVLELALRGPGSPAMGDPARSGMIGAILALNYTFEGCAFTNVVFMAPPELARQVRRRLGSTRRTRRKRWDGTTTLRPRLHGLRCPR